MASQVRAISKTQADSKGYSDGQGPGPVIGTNGLKSKQRLTALSVEFVAKPEEARRAEHVIAASIDASLREVGGYAGCLVMISNQEARLITVITFWSGPHGAQLCRQNTRWVNALLKPYMDRCLRSQTVLAQLPEELLQSPGNGRPKPIQAEQAETFESELLTVA